MGSKNAFWVILHSQAHFGSFKVCTNVDTTLENIYTVKLA